MTSIVRATSSSSHTGSSGTPPPVSPSHSPSSSALFTSLPSVNVSPSSKWGTSSNIVKVASMFSARSFGTTSPSSKQQGDKRRREEAELRALIQSEVRNANNLQLQLDDQEAEMDNLQKQTSRQEELAADQQRSIVNDLARWERRLAQRSEAVALKQQELQDVLNQLQRLKDEENQHRVMLSAKFVRVDMKPNFTVDPDEIFTPAVLSMGSPRRSKHNLSTIAAEVAAAGESTPGGGTTPLSESLKATPSAGPSMPTQRSRAATLSRLQQLERTRPSVVGAFETLNLEPQLAFLRECITGVHNEAVELRDRYTSEVRSDLQKLYLELGTLTALDE